MFRDISVAFEKLTWKLQQKLRDDTVVRGSCLRLYRHLISHTLLLRFRLGLLLKSRDGTYGGWGEARLAELPDQLALA